MIGNAIAMGMTVSEFWKLSPWEFQAACDGWLKSHTDAIAPPSDEDLDKALAELVNENAW